MDNDAAEDQATRAEYHEPEHPKDPFTFESCPLKDPGDIRVLCLLPGGLKSPIECILATHSLTVATKDDQNREYEALSYVRDQGEPTYSIEIHTAGHSASVLHITPNLHAALEHLRDRKSARLLWIDAICIDLANVEEKNHQISLMADIYRRAEHVCIWLGQGSHEFDRALDFIGRAADMLATSAWGWSEPNWWAFYSFISSPWFRRRWSIQEIALARKATLICGNHTVGWHEFANALSIVQEVMTGFSNDRAYFDTSRYWGQMSLQPAFRLAEIRKNLCRIPRDEDDLGSLRSLETLMWKFQDFETSDPRDAIYALLALAKGRRPNTKQRMPSIINEFRRSDLMSPDFDSLKSFAINYDRPSLDVCKDYIFSAIQTSGSLDVLCRPWKPYEEAIGLFSIDIPSWLSQNWSSTFGRTKYGKYGRIKAEVLVGPPDVGKRYYNASGSLSVTKACRFGTGMKNSSMYVEGLVVDTISEKQTFARIGSERGITSDSTLDMWRAAGGWMESAEEPPDAYWRTLVADRGPNGSDTPDFYPLACRRQGDICHRLKDNYKESLGTPMSRAADALVAKFVHRVQDVVVGRRRVNTERGRLGLAPYLTKKRDLVCILFGCSVPVLLRPHQDAYTGQEYFQFIGESYIHGIMDGEALELARRESDNDTISKQEFELR